jgi:hypothetical protein
MTKKKVRPLDQHDWDQLLIVAAGFLPLVGGDLKQAMAKAIVAHAELVGIVKKEGLRAELPKGVARLYVEEGALQIAYESHSSSEDSPPDLAMEVPDRPPQK